MKKGWEFSGILKKGEVINLVITTGEELIGTIEKDLKDYYVMKDLVSFVYNKHGSGPNNYYYIKYLPFSNGRIVKLYKNQIVVVAPLSDRYKESYGKALTKINMTPEEIRDYNKQLKEQQAEEYLNKLDSQGNNSWN